MFFKKTSEKILKTHTSTLFNARYKSGEGLVVRAVRDWKGEISCLKTRSLWSSVWQERSVSILTHGIPQSTMSWDNRTLAFSILKESSLTFRHISDRDLYGKAVSSLSLAEDAASKQREDLVTAIHRRGEDVAPRLGWSLADVQSVINESIVDIEGGLSAVEAVAFKADEKMQEFDTLFDRTKGIPLHAQVNDLSGLIDLALSKILVEQFAERELPLLILERETDEFIPCSMTADHILVLQEASKRIQSMPQFKRTLEEPTNYDRKSFLAFIRLSESLDQVKAGKFSGVLRGLNSFNKVCSFFNRSASCSKVPDEAVKSNKLGLR